MVSARSLALNPLYDGSYPTAWYRPREEGGKAADVAPAVFSRDRF